MNKTSFLNYYKTILEKVSFDKELLAKEYRKALQILEASESKDLEYWLRANGLTVKMDASDGSKTYGKGELKMDFVSYTKPTEPQPMQKNRS